MKTWGNGLAAGVILGLAVFAGQAHASCGTSQRVSASDSECLEESHSNGGYTATNHCVHGIKVKIDVKGGSDQTRTVAAAGQRFVVCLGSSTCVEALSPASADKVVILPTVETGFIDTSWGRRIRSVTCCSDYSTCDRRDADSYPAD